MLRLVAALFVLTPLLASGASAQSITMCEQTVQYNLVPPPPDVPAELRAFSGVWVGNWANQLCHVLVVEEIAGDGTVRTKYVWGTNPNWGISKPGINPWSGRISGGVLTLRNNTVSVEYQLKSPTELAGVYTRGNQYPGVFTKR